MKEIESDEEYSEIEKQLDLLLGFIPDYEEQIVRRLFGIGIDAPQTIEMIAEDERVPPLMISQTRTRAFQQLRDPDRLRLLNCYVIPDKSRVTRDFRTAAFR